MTVKREEIKTTRIRESLCNLCGFSCDLSKEKLPEWHQGEFRPEGGLIEEFVFGGYDSTPGNGYGALDDNVSYRFSLCEFCLDFLFQKFVIPPIIHDNSDMDCTQFVPAKERVLRDEWRTDKQDFLDEAAKRDKARRE